MESRKVSQMELDSFFNEVFFERFPNIKFSYLFKIQCFALHLEQRFPDYEYRLAISAIAAGQKQATGVVDDQEFEDPPLKGLWKKHVFSSDNLYHNLIAEIRSPETITNQKLKDFFELHSGESVTDIATQLAHILVIDALDNRSRESRMTGEWIVYGEIGDTRYILTMAKHKEGKNRKETNQLIFERISKTGFVEFPELKRS